MVEATTKTTTEELQAKKEAVSQDATKAQNPEEETKKDGEAATQKLIKGMRELEVKNVVVNLESKKYTSWESLNVPSEIEQGLA